LYDSFGDAAWFQSDEPKHGDHSICSKPVIPVVPKNLSNSVREQVIGTRKRTSLLRALYIS